jgi:phenylalanyl-tRNA synthetase alpha subunit
LRETLESETHKTSQAIQLVKSANQGEISILKHTVGAMRDQLDVVNANHRATIQTALVEVSEEIRQLKETTSMLRQEMESMEFKAKSDEQIAKSAYEVELLQLRETISAMRTQMVRIN